LRCVDGVFQLFFPEKMTPRDKKKPELRPVDEVAESRAPVVRLQQEGKQKVTRVSQVEETPHPEHESYRLDVTVREGFENRTHQPGVEALVETPTEEAPQTEELWGHDPDKQSIPWGWFVLLLLLIGGALVWSLTRVTESKAQVEQIQDDTYSKLAKDAEEDAEAEQFITNIETTIRNFSSATTVDEAVLYVRHPERVRKLMEHHAAEGTQLSKGTPFRTSLLQPLTLDNRANYWMATLQFADQSKRNLILEILENGDVKIDWETFVCYQPMDWDRFATERPEGISFDFRVFVEAYEFFSHEFVNSNQWACYRLTALDRDETLFGYVLRNSEIETQIQEILEKNQGQNSSLILRLNVPEGLQSRRGVVIEQMLSPRWIYLDPPES
jgi:hypothetical protein